MQTIDQIINYYNILLHCVFVWNNVGCADHVQNKWNPANNVGYIKIAHEQKINM